MTKKLFVQAITKYLLGVVLVGLSQRKRKAGRTKHCCKIEWSHVFGRFYCCRAWGSF